MQIEPAMGPGSPRPPGDPADGLAYRHEVDPAKGTPAPGAQLRITDADGLRVTGFLTNTIRGGPGTASSPTWNYATAVPPGRGPHPGRVTASTRGRQTT